MNPVITDPGVEVASMPPPSAYDQWLMAQVQKAMDDPRAAVNNDEVKRYFANQRAALRKRIGGEAA